MGCLTAVVLVFAAAAASLITWGVLDAFAAGWHSASAKIIGGLIILALAAVLWLNGRRGYHQQKQAIEVHQQYPNEPWLWNKSWADGCIQDSDRTSMVVAWIFAAAFLGLGLPATIAAFAQAHNKDFSMVYLVLLFPLVGTLFLIWALTEVFRRLKFGTSVLELATSPGVLGGQLVGVIYTRHKLAPESGYHLQLRCIHRLVTVSGGESETRETVLWEDEATMIRGLMDEDTSRTAIPVGFHIPATCQQSDDADPKSSIYWQLQARAKVPGLDYRATFIVPVFRTAETPQLAQSPQVDPVAAYRAPVTPQTAPSLPGITHQQIPSGLELRFRAARNPGATLMMTLFALIFSGIGIGLGYYGHIWFFAATFGLVGFFLLIAVARAWLLATRIAIVEGLVRLESRFPGICRTRTLPARDIADVFCDAAMRSGQTTFYRLRLKTTAGRTLTIASGIPKRKEADWLADQIREALTQDTPPTASTNDESTQAHPGGY
jgi:hypothetical protein